MADAGPITSNGGVLVDGGGNPIICDYCDDCQQTGDCAYVIVICNSNGLAGAFATDDVYNIVLNDTTIYSNLDLTTDGTECPGLMFRTIPDIPASVLGLSACCTSDITPLSLLSSLIVEGENELRMDFVSSNDHNNYGLVGVYQVYYDGADWQLHGICFEDEYAGDSGTSFTFNFNTCQEPCPPAPCGSGPTASFDSLLTGGCTYQFTNTSTPGDCGPILSCRWNFQIELYDGQIIQLTREGCSITVNFNDLITEFLNANQLTEICPDLECGGVVIGPIANPLMGCGADSVQVTLTVTDEAGYEDSASDTVACGCGIPAPSDLFAVYSFTIPIGGGLHNAYIRVLSDGPYTSLCGRPLCASVVLSLNIDFGLAECGPCIDPDTCAEDSATVNICRCENIYEDDECDGGTDGTETYPPETGNQYGFGQTLPYPDNPYTEEELGALPALSGCATVKLYMPATNCCGPSACYEVTSGENPDPGCC